MTCADERFYLVSSQLGADSPFYWNLTGILLEYYWNKKAHPHLRKGYSFLRFTFMWYLRNRHPIYVFKLQAIWYAACHVCAFESFTIKHRDVCLLYQTVIARIEIVEAAYYKLSFFRRFLFC